MKLNRYSSLSLLCNIIFILITKITFPQVQFASHTIVGGAYSAEGAYSVYAVDLDGDGDTDLLSASHDNDRITWYENDGNENFTPHKITSSRNGAVSVYALDVDGDGDIDVLSASVSDISKSIGSYNYQNMFKIKSSWDSCEDSTLLRNIVVALIVIQYAPSVLNS